MGYDIHITRARLWAESDQNPITAEEWLALVEEDPELTPQESALQGGYGAAWSGPSIYPDPWFTWWDGQIYTKNPDDAMWQKMAQIARHFGAIVQGDDGEIYFQTN